MMAIIALIISLVNLFLIIFLLLRGRYYFEYEYPYGKHRRLSLWKRKGSYSKRVFIVRLKFLPRKK